MVISFVLDWTSYWIGFASAVVGSFLVLFGLAAVQYKKQSKGRRKL